jgi:hypothetical protein
MKKLNLSYSSNLLTYNAVMNLCISSKKADLLYESLRHLVFCGSCFTEKKISRSLVIGSYDTIQISFKILAFVWEENF